MYSVLDLMNLQTPHSPQEGEEKEQGIQYLSLDRIQYIIVDEADRMLDISFLFLSLFYTFLIILRFQRTIKSYVF